MIDGIIKGDGTSRLARSVANITELYPTYESFAAALAAGTLPLDILFHAEGWSQLPDFLNKATLLKDDTAALYGLGTEAVPDDVFNILLRAITSGEGAILAKIVDSSDLPLSGAIEVDDEVYVVPRGGYIFLRLPQGQHRVSFQTYFFNCASPNRTVQVEANKISIVTFECSLINHGTIDVTASSKIGIPHLITSLDLFAAGAGGSGAAAGSSSRLAVTGGAGGYTATLLKQNLSEKVLTISIGAGGQEVTTTYEKEEVSGNAGGTTKIEIGETVVLEASGGSGGRCKAGESNASSVSGGSDSGYVSSRQANRGGQDGKPGQGTTTRAFGESSGELYCSGGGAAYGEKESSTQSSFDEESISQGGQGAGEGTTTTKASAFGVNATTKGSGGGPIISAHRNTSNNPTSITSGRGGDGLVKIRW